MKTKKYYETKEFQQLNKEWESKLKESGFSDIEKPSKRYTNVIQNEEFEYCEKKENHFDICREYLNSGRIKDELDVKIFSLYCEGYSLREIEAKINGRLTKTPLAYRINKLLEIING